MHTTGLASEPIGRLYEGEALAAALRDARQRTLALYAHLDLEALRVPRLAIVNPPLWELAHVAWFQEYWCLRHSPALGGPARDPMLPGADALFDSARVAHASRWELDYPGVARLRRYMDETLAATLERLARTPADSRYFFELALLHEDMHGEALLMTLQTLALPAPQVPSIDLDDAAASPARDIAFAGGEFRLGAEPGARAFTFDNEKWAHPVTLAPFAMAAAPTTQGEFAAFVEDGGYERAPLWDAEGWAWRMREDRAAPLNWRRDGGRWLARRFDRWDAIAPGQPMVHVSLHEARAFCRWARRRLPTEAEWEFAAREGEGLEQLFGGVWQWTASAFAPYPGFAPDPYREYSQPWFHTHQVLRGSSFATRARLANSRFRNFYLPERADVFAGLRTCAESP